MKDFDQYLKDKAAETETEVPASVRARIEQTLAELPEKNVPARKMHHFPRIAAAAACLLITLLFLLPNVSVAYAQALEQIPIIGDIVRVVTIRNYFYSDDKHEMDIDVPKIEGADSEAVDLINQDVSELTNVLVHRFYEDLEIVGDNGHGAIYVNYEIVTDTTKWFTLKLRVHEAAGSSNTYYKYYHINKLTGEMMQLGDLASSDEFYDVLTQEIKEQMKTRMASDPNIIYWLDDNTFGSEFVSVTEDHNFYWNENGEMVIVFDKYEVAPGAMGTPEFTIGKEVLQAVLKPEFLDIVS